MSRENDFFKENKINKNLKNTGYSKEISKKILENKVILFLGAGFSRNFGLPTWKELVDEIICEGIDLNKEYTNTKQIENLNRIKDSLDKQPLLLILDIVLENILVLSNQQDKRTFLEDIYRKQLNLEKYIKNNNSDRKQEISLNLRILIDKIFNKILTINYDDIFNYSNGKEIKKVWKYINERISTPNQKYDKWIYLIHGTIVNENKLPFINTYLSFIENWKNNAFVESFQKLLKESINDKHIFLFIGCSFDDNFVLSEIAAFISNNNFNKEEMLFYVLWDDIIEEKETNKHEVNKEKFQPLSNNWLNIKFIRLSTFSENHNIKVESKSSCVINFFDYISNLIKINKRDNKLLNDISNVKFSEIFKEKFDNIEKYFKKLITSIINQKLS